MSVEAANDNGGECITVSQATWVSFWHPIKTRTWREWLVLLLAVSYLASLPFYSYVSLADKAGSAVCAVLMVGAVANAVFTLALKVARVLEKCRAEVEGANGGGQ